MDLNKFFLFKNNPRTELKGGDFFFLAYLQDGVKWPWQEKARDLSCELQRYFRIDESRTAVFSEEHITSVL